MTTQTRTDIVSSLCSRCGDSCGWCHPDIVSTLEDQTIMAAYLSDYASESAYRREASNAVEFLAVLATEEYHRHWKGDPA
jgi:hypothetical protein